MSPEMRVRVIAKKTKRRNKEYETLYVRIPRTIANALGLKSGSTLRLIIRNVEVNGKQRLALVYFKEEGS